MSTFTDTPAALPLSAAEVFFDGIFSEPRLQHPEGIAIDAQGSIWCGSENGDVHRISPDGTSIETVASTGGFVLGIAFDSSGQLYCCDLMHRAVFRLDPDRGAVTPFADGGGDLRIPNFAVVDERRGALFVTDSYAPGEPGPGVWRFDLETGRGSLWFDAPMVFANGMALDIDGESLLVVESFARRLTRIPIMSDGRAGQPRTVAEDLGRVPDGIALDVHGNAYISCYEPSCIYRVAPSGDTTLLIADPEAHTFCHPTNTAFRGEELFAANLGRWHITRVHVGVEGHPLPSG
jgi:sugar lactone lactonase YvrE